MKRLPIRLIRLVGLLLCGTSVLLEVAHPLAKAGETSYSLLTALAPFTIPPLVLKVLNLLTPAMIGALFWSGTAEAKIDIPRVSTYVLLAFETVATLLLCPELQFVIAMQVGLLLRPMIGALWVFTQIGALWLSALLNPELTSWVIPKDTADRVIATSLLMLVSMLYNLFSFALGLLANMERRQRREALSANRELQAANLELRGTQRRAEQAARLEEWLTIARELHDAVGHQLTALSVNLQVATNLARDDARPYVLEAYSTTSALLREVRRVVSSMRDPAVSDLNSALEAMALRIPAPVIHLDLKAELDLYDCSFGPALFRCAQEVVTNTVRHAGANNLWIATRVADGNLLFTARDDGKGSSALAPGNGLAGIQERVAHLNGTVEFKQVVPQGFAVLISVPVSSN